MEDFYGRELAAGDKVLYGSGYASVREGIIEKITDNYITVRAHRDGYGPKTRTRYYHEVTGKWIDPWFHKAQEPGYYHKETGEAIPYENQGQYLYSGWGGRVENRNYVPADLREYRQATYKDYVKSVELKGGSVSVIYNPKGIIKLPLGS